MLKSKEQDFLLWTKKELQKVIANQGLLLLNMDMFDKIILEICKAYHEIEKEEEIF